MGGKRAVKAAEPAAASGLPVVVVPVATGNAKLSETDRARIEDAVQQAEALSGLQFLIYIGRTGSEIRTQAHQLLEQQGYTTVPGVLVMVEPHRHQVEVVTSEQGRERLSDEACSRAIDIMVPAFQRGDWVAGLELGIASLAESVTSPLPGSPAILDLPNILE